LKIDTGLNKFSAAVGDNSVIGVNSVINPGTLLGKNVIVFPLKSVSGVHENNAAIK
jgi:UDP-3-O-[3-hydroxymyristoyl] glucosamine N-acyltransferase